MKTIKETRFNQVFLQAKWLVESLFMDVLKLKTHWRQVWWYPKTSRKWTQCSGPNTPLHNITYFVISRRSIEIWRVCKIYGRRGGAEPSIYFTNPPYFYRPSWTDQISVLFRQGPWIVYAVTKIGRKSTQPAYIYGRDLRAKMWRYDLRGRRHKRRCENKGRHDAMPLLKSMKKTTLVRC